MPDRIQSQKIICQGGLNTRQNYLELSQTNPGFATRLVNYESSLTGGYRRISGFTPYDTTYHEVTSVADPAEGAVLGIFGFLNPSTNSFQILACRKQTSGNTYKFYELTGSGWVALSIGFTLSSIGVEVVRSETSDFGSGNVIVFVDGVNKALLYNGSTWYQLSSSNTGGTASPGGNQLIDAPAYVTSFKGTIFFSGDSTKPAITAYSAPNDPYTWTAAAGGGQLILGFKVVQIRPFRDELYIFGSQAIKKALPDEAAGFILQDVTNNLGCMAQDTVLEVAGNLIFLSHDGLRIVAGTAKIGDVDLTTISENITSTLTTAIDTYDMTRVRSTIIRSKTQFRYFFSDPATDTTDSYGIIGSLVSKDGNVYWEFGELLGISSACTWSGYDNNHNEIILHGDYSGLVHKQEVGSSFNGNDITAIFETPYLDFGDTEIRKTMRVLNVFTKATGSFNFAIGVTFDWGDLSIINPVDYNETLGSALPQYDAGYLYDSGATYGAITQPILHTNIQGSGFSTKFSFVSNGTDSSYTIQGIVIEYSAKGRD